MKIMVNVVVGLMKRLIEMILLFMVSPPIVAIMPMDNGNFNQFQQPNESTIKRGYKIDEIVNGVLNGTENDKHPYQKTDNKKSFRKKPFSSPNFEN